MDTTNAPQLVELFNQSLAFTPYDTKWIPYSSRVVVTGVLPKGTGVVQIHQIITGKAVLSSEVSTASGIKCVTVSGSAVSTRELAVGAFDGTLSVYDVDNLTRPIWKVEAHDTLVNCIDRCGGSGVGGGAPELVTGSRDGCVRVWDTRASKPVVSLEPEGSDGTSETNLDRRDCWAVAFGNSFNDSERVVVAGYDNGDVKLFDLRTNKMRWETNCKNGICALEFDRKDIEMNKLIVTTLESKFRVYDMRTEHPTDGFAHVQAKAHKSTVWGVRYLPQNRDLFMTTGGNGGLNLYKYSYPAQRQTKDSEGRAKGVAGTVEMLNSRVISTQPIVSFDWSPDKEGLAVLACLDQTLRLYNVNKVSLI